MLAVTRSPHQQLLEGERCVTLNAGGLYLNALFFFCRLISTQGSSEWNLHDKNSQFIAEVERLRPRVRFCDEWDSKDAESGILPPCDLHETSGRTTNDFNFAL